MNRSYILRKQPAFNHLVLNLFQSLIKTNGEYCKRPMFVTEGCKTFDSNYPKKHNLSLPSHVTANHICLLQLPIKLGVLQYFGKTLFEQKNCASNNRVIICLDHHGLFIFTLSCTFISFPNVCVVVAPPPLLLLFYILLE